MSQNGGSLGSRLLYGTCFVALLLCTAALLWRVNSLQAMLAAAPPGVHPAGVQTLLDESFEVPLRGTVELSESTARRAVVFVFTPGDCSICLEELSTLDVMDAMHADVETYALLSYSNDDEEAQLRSIFGFGFPVLHDPDGRILETLDLPKTPWKLILDPRSGRVVYQEPPSVTEVEREAFASRVSTLGSL